MNPNYKA